MATATGKRAATQPAGSEASRMTVKVLGVRGRTRAQSYSGRAVGLALEAAREQGAETLLLDLRLTQLPRTTPTKRRPTAKTFAARYRA